MNIYLEIFGYIGTALVIVSMMMTSLVKLRIINMCGGLISLIYAICVHTWPIVVLNVCLISINFVQTVRQLRGKEAVTLLSVKGDDPIAAHLLGIWKKDFEKYHPNLNFQAMKEEEIHILYVGEEAVGFFAAACGNRENLTNALYLIPAHRTAAMKARASEMLAKQI